MKEKFVKDLAKNDQLNSEQFVVTSVKKNMTKSGDDYYRIEISDKTGSMSANIWKDNIPNCEPEALIESTVVNLWGKVEEFKGALQININSLGVAKEYDVADFMAQSERDVNEMWTEFKAHIASIENKDIQDLITKIFSNLDFAEKYKTHPAGERVHHAFQSGLLEHVLEMLDLCEVMFKYYPMADKSLVKAGIIFHDIGKLFELENKQISIERTTSGNLIGHIIQGYEFVSSMVDDNFPEDLLMKLKHIILSHHGILEYGSPVVPMTIEAVIVSQMDDASSKIRQYQRVMKENEGKDSEFSDRDYILGTKVYLK